MSAARKSSSSNYVAFVVRGRPRIGTLDFDTDIITAIAYNSGAPVSSLYEVIELGEDAFRPTSETFPLADVKLLPPISGRDVLAVGKNYVEHAEEFHSSGFDSSDKTAQPTHPVIFTKRATSIIAHRDAIFPHPDFSSSVDYEGEIGVIVGRPGFRIAEAFAMAHVWGYTIINDVTARERQRDHKQFFIGKSPDTFCPMGPVAVPKEHLPDTLALQTHVNGEKRQDADTSQLIFSIPYLIKTLSEGQTLQAGDVIATGTPVGVGFGFRPMKFLQPGDEVSVSVTGLGTLTNTISASPTNPTPARLAAETTHVPVFNRRLLDVTARCVDLKTIGDKQLFYTRIGAERATATSHVVFLHGLGGSVEYFAPLVPYLQRDDTALHLLDLEGQGLSPTSAASTTTIASFAVDVAAVLASEGVVNQTTVVAHDLGCLVAAQLALTNPALVSSLILMGPPSTPTTPYTAQVLLARAQKVRAGGMPGVADTMLADGVLSGYTLAMNPLAMVGLRLAVGNQHPEGYTKACEAFVSASAVDWSQIRVPTLFVTGGEDRVARQSLVEEYAAQVAGSKVRVLEGVGHWHVFEDIKGVADAVVSFLDDVRRSST